MSFSVFEKIDPSCQNGSMEKAKNIPYHQRPYASIAERTLVDISIYSPRPQIAGTGHSHSKISIHSPRAGRDCRYPNAPLITQISIHSPRMGRDTDGAGGASDLSISIHSPRMGRDADALEAARKAMMISIHSPRMGRDQTVCAQRLQPDAISIHSPRMGRDSLAMSSATARAISIHSPRMGRDFHVSDCVKFCSNFNPLSPHGERPKCNRI